MPLGDDVATVLQTGGVGTIATDIFVGVLPDNIDNGVLVKETGGIFPLHTMGSGPATAIPNAVPVAAVERPRVQIIVRDTSYKKARIVAQQCYNLLDGLVDRTINSVLYHRIEAVQSPIDLGREEGNDRQMFSLNFDVTKEGSTSTST